MAAGKKVLPGFQLTLGYTLFYLFLVVLIPLSALLFKTFSLSWDQFWSAVASPRVLASYRLTFGASLLAASINVVAGLLVLHYHVVAENAAADGVDAAAETLRQALQSVSARMRPQQQ